MDQPPGLVTNDLVARATATQAATRRLLNAYLRETGTHDPRSAPEDPRFRVVLPASGRVLVGILTYWSVLGHHVYGDDLRVQYRPHEAPLAVTHTELVDLLLAELVAFVTDEEGTITGGDTAPRRQAELAAQIGNSVERTARYLARGRSSRPAEHDPWALTRSSEQSVLFGHPLHPTPKSAEGFSAEDTFAYAPELGASFPLHYAAIAEELVVRRRVAPGIWVPEDVRAEVRRRGLPPCREYALLPVHPWQAGYLLRQEAVQRVAVAGVFIPLGALGRSVYPTSSVRTVCDPAFATSWKLPLHVRITNFIRNNPLEHVRRAADASSLIAAHRSSWRYQDVFEVLVETGYQTIDHPDLAAEVSVLYRENPFAKRAEAPQVLAGLLEEQPDGGEPDLLRYVREAVGGADTALPADRVADWLKRYLAISLLPLLNVFSRYGISLEAHVQNSLLHLEGGWPTRFYVRDMEGTSVSRERVADALEPDSPALYDETEAWKRFQYYVVTNHLGHLLHVLGRYGQLDERLLWAVVASSLRAALPDPYAAALLDTPVLPAKANLISRFAERGEHPVHVSVPNPIHEANR